MDAPQEPGTKPGADGSGPNEVDEFVRGIYDQLRGLAAAYLRHERPGHTLQPTALVNEAYLRLSKLAHAPSGDPTRFFAAAAGTIRRVLVDHARARRTARRGGGWDRITLTGLEGEAAGEPIDLMALDEALLRLAECYPRALRVVELRYFGGLTIEQTARVLGIGKTTVKESWEFAKAWLRRELEKG